MYNPGIEKKGGYLAHVLQSERGVKTVFQWEGIRSVTLNRRAVTVELRL